MFPSLLTTVMLVLTRPAMLDYFANYDGQGVARRYQWTPEGELTTSLIWMYKVQ